MYYPVWQEYQKIPYRLKKNFYTKDKGFEDRKVTAYHEAGHTLVAIRLKLAFEKCKLKKNIEEGGITKLSEPGNNADHLARFHIAGIISQYLSTGTFKPWDYCLDFIQMICLLDFNHANIPGIVHELAEEIGGENRQIQKIAEELLIKRVLYPADLKRIGIY